MKSDSDDRLIDQFEDDIKTGTSPDIESVLTLLPEESRHRILLELISIEIFHCVRKGRQVGNTSYARFGEEAVAHANRVKEQYSKSKTIKGADSDDLSSRSAVPASSGIGNSTRLPFQTIGPYRLIAQLGVGGMGTEWLAEQERPVKRRVALKLIKTELPSREVLARFDAEKQALAMMAHPNIARVIDAGNTDDGRPYFVMELVDGIPITTLSGTIAIGISRAVSSRAMDIRAMWSRSLLLLTESGWFRQAKTGRSDYGMQLPDSNLANLQGMKDASAVSPLARMVPQLRRLGVMRRSGCGMQSQVTSSIRYSPDGKRLVSGSRDGTVRIWSAHGDNDLTLGGHSTHVH